jgi:hypothetical protein
LTRPDVIGIAALTALSFGTAAVAFGCVGLAHVGHGTSWAPAPWVTVSGDGENEAPGGLTASVRRAPRIVV